MDTGPEYLEQLWSDLLSRQPEQILTAFDSLDDASQTAVSAHLHRMASESGWQPDQRKSAFVALQVLENRLHQG